MALSYPMPLAEEARIVPLEARLAAADVQLLLGTVVDLGGVVRAKAVPAGRLRSFHSPGLGASPSWHVFCIDNAVAFTPALNVVGDQRLRLDLDAVRLAGDELAWAPAEFHEQTGEPSPLCSRGLLRGKLAALHAAGLTASAGFELEFVLTGADGALPTSRPWHAYGADAVLDQQGFIAELAAACERAGLPLAQIHAEYGDGQYELSFAPTDPLTAADDVVLARLLIGRLARRRGLAASFSPLPFAGGSGNGAHLHLSLARDGKPLFSGGSGPHGLTDEGGSAVAGVVAGLTEVIGVLAGSPLSRFRLLPGHWSGAHACWGRENREAAVRFCAAGPGNPGGANVEVKCVDPAANPYLAAAVILGLALDGVGRAAALPAEVPGNPADLSPLEADLAGALPLPTDQKEILATMADSALLRRLLGGQLLDALLAVRRHELTYRDHEPAELADRFRFAWSV